MSDEFARDQARRLGVPWPGDTEPTPETRTRHHVPETVGGPTNGYIVPEVCRTSGISYRRLDYWDRTGLLKPSLAPARGSGSQRRYSVDDIVVLVVIRKLLETGLSLQKIRHFVEHLRSLDDMHQSFVTDGDRIATFVDVTLAEVVADFGPTYWAISVAVAYREVEEKLGLVSA